jgi:predicted nucleotidyltransferase
MPPVYGSMMPAMASETTILDPAVAERERVLRILRESEPELRARGVVRLRLFGSMARGEAGPESDVDLVAEIDRRRNKFSLIDHIGLEQDLADVLGRPVEISTAPWKMRPRMRARVEADAIEVF